MANGLKGIGQGALQQGTGMANGFKGLFTKKRAQDLQKFGISAANLGLGVPGGIQQLTADIKRMNEQIKKLSRGNLNLQPGGLQGIAAGLQEALNKGMGFGGAFPDMVGGQQQGIGGSFQGMNAGFQGMGGGPQGMDANDWSKGFGLGKQSMQGIPRNRGRMGKGNRRKKRFI